jgi:lipopolysaccharide assembly outer membrane protein LptD (OstA)
MACGSTKPEAPKPDEKPQPKTAEPIAVATAAGETTHLSEKNEKMWRITWKAAEVVATGAAKVGNMVGIKGETYEKENVSSLFEADFAEADNKVNRLILKGNVKIAASNGTMFADQVEFDGKQSLYKAIGKVTFESESGIVGPIDSLYASSHTDKAGKAILDKVGTSETFFKK